MVGRTTPWVGTSARVSPVPFGVRSAPEAGQRGGLRAAVLRGGMHMTARQGVGLLLRVGSFLLLTRFLGPVQSGLFAAPANMFVYLLKVGEWGVPVYLVRSEEADREGTYHQAFTLALLLGLGVALLTLALLPLIEGWVGLEGFGSMARVMFAMLPVALVGQVPRARLERRLDFRAASRIDLMVLGANYAVSLPMAAAGFGAWAPVSGWCFGHVANAVLGFRAARYSPRLYWNGPEAGRMLRYGLTYTAAEFVRNLRSLVLPLIVAPYAGAQAVGYVFITARLLDALVFVQQIVYRIAMAALARVQSDHARLRSAVSEGIGLQVLAVGPFLVAFAWAGGWVVHLTLGSRWLPVLDLYPFMALALLTQGVFGFHASVLHVLKRNVDVAIARVVDTTLFALGALWLVPRVGAVGFGLADLLSLASGAVLHAMLSRAIGSPDYRLAAVWWAAFGLALFYPYVGWWAGAGLAGIALWPATWRQLARLLAAVRGGRP